jgi:hypothetical protein
MDSDQIERIVKLALKCTSYPFRQPTNRAFTGVFAIDELHNANLSVCGELRVCIVNTMPSTHPGEHWLVVGLDRRQNEWDVAIVLR